MTDSFSRKWHDRVLRALISPTLWVVAAFGEDTALARQLIGDVPSLLLRQRQLSLLCFLLLDAIFLWLLVHMGNHWRVRSGAVFQMAWIAAKAASYTASGYALMPGAWMPWGNLLNMLLLIGGGRVYGLLIWTALSERIGSKWMNPFHLHPSAK